jgi:D-glycero-D-manno-heptose 1,7-bisphosphate phosphatase
MKRRALFLDRDGVINVDHGHVHTADSFQFMDDIFDLVAAARGLGYLVIVVTNQGGIGRGYYTEDDFLALTDWMESWFTAQGAPIDAVYFCPNHPVHGLGRYREKTSMRKPGPGMLLQARDDFDIDLSCSIMIGDKLTDMQAGAAAGVGTLLWLNPDKDAEPGRPIFALCDAIAHLTPAPGLLARST